MKQINVSPELAKIVSWVQDEIQGNPFCDVGFTVTVHDGKIRKVQKKLEEKIQVDRQPKN